MPAVTREAHSPSHDAPNGPSPSLNAHGGIAVRHRLASLVVGLVLLLVSGLLGGCSSPAATDPYQLLEASTKTAWNPVQVNVGFQVKAGTQDVTLDRSSIGVVIDSAAGKGAVHLTFPATSLGIPKATLTQLGVTGNSIDFDAVFDGDALYAKSPLFTTLVPQLLAGEVPEGNLADWLRFGTRAEFAALAALAGNPGAASAAPSSGSGSFKTDLEAAGFTISLIGTDKLASGDAHHLKVTIDSEKLLNSPQAKARGEAQLGQARAALAAIDLSADIWVQTATNHIVEIDGHATPKGTSTGAATFTIVFHDPDGTIPLEAPAKHVDLPTAKLLQNLMTLVGSGLPTS